MPFQNPVFLETSPQAENIVHLDFPLLPVPGGDERDSGDETKLVDAMVGEQAEFTPMGNASAVQLGVERDVDEADSSERRSPKRRKVRFG